MLALLALLLVGCQWTDASKRDIIRKFPGQPDGYSFKQYGGYVGIDSASNKNFYYFFVEATSSPETKPVVLWLNGGPGCSSIHSGFFSEHGPWRLTGPNTNRLAYNPFSWNTEANMIYLESPTGVGFSYSNDINDYSLGDNQTALDNYAFLFGWFKKFPQFKNNPFFITGESYAGTYIPLLVDLILRKNKNPKLYPDYVKLNFKGMMIGNPYFGSPNVFQIAEFLYYHNVLPTSAYEQFYAACHSGVAFDCYSAISFVYTYLGSVDVYDLNGLICLNSAYGSTPGIPATFLNFDLLHGLKKSKSKLLNVSSLAAVQPASKVVYAPSTVPKPFSLTDPACNLAWIFRYLNNPSNQKRLNVNAGGFAANGNLSLACSGTSGYANYGDVRPLFNSFFKAGLRFWLYSGDADSVVPFTQTRADIEDLNRTVINPTQPWYYFDQPGGYVTDYDGIKTITVRDAGHLVPIRQPERALYVFKQFLEGRALSIAPFAHDRA